MQSKIWQILEEAKGAWGSETSRMEVPGGWIYRVREWGGEDNAFSTALVFVSHLEDPQLRELLR